MSKGVFIFNKNMEFVHSLAPDKLTENYMDAVLNGLITGGYTTTEIDNYDNYHYFGVKEDGNFHMFKMTSVVKEYDLIRVYGIHIMFDELQGVVIRDMRPRKQAVNITLDRMLEDTDWQAGSVVVSGTFSGSFYYQSVLSALYELCDRAKCEFQPVVKFSRGKIVSKELQVFDNISGDYGKLFMYGDNLLKVVAETSTDNLFTAFIGRGKGEQIFDENGQATGGYGRKISFKDIDYSNTKYGVTVHSPKGQDYIEIKEATAMYGYPNGKPRVREVPFDEIEDPVELADATFDFALENSRPKLQLRASGLQFDTVSLGEIVTIIGKNDIRYKTRVFKIKKDFLREKVVSFEFGDRIARTMGDRLKAEQVAEKEKEITEQNYIKSMIELVENSYFNEDGYQYDLKAGNEYDLPAGIYSFNKPIDQNPDKVIYFGAGKLMIANSKKPDGSWNFSVAIDGDAVNANVIRAGILRGGRVEWDLQNGTFKIGGQRDEANILQDPNMYWDGNTLHLRDVDIDLSNNYQVQNIENNLTNLDSKIDSASSDFDTGIKGLQDSVDATVARIDGDIAGVDSKLDQTSQDMEANLEAAKADFGVKFDLVDKQITTVSQDLKIGQGKLESAITGRIDGLANVVETNQAGFESYKLENVKVIGDIRSDIKQTAGSIETSVASQIQTVNDKIDSKDAAVRDFVKTNYSTTLQTDEKIKSTVASEVAVLDGKISGANDSLKKYVETNYSTKEQTDKAITNTVAREVKTVDENLRSYISGNYSTTTQTADMIQSTVSDEVDKAKLALGGDSAELREYIETNYSTKTQTKDAITSEVVSASKVLKDDISRDYYTKSQTDSKIKQTADSIETTVTQVNNALYGGGYDKNGKYIPANESITSKISQTAGMIESKVSGVINDVSGLKTRMSTAESKITQTSNSITSKVSKGEIISEINQTPEAIKIKASKLDINIGSIENQLVTLEADMNGVKLGVSDVKSDLTTEIQARKDGITSAVSDAKSQLRSEFNQTADGLSTKVGSLSSRVSSAESSITQTKDMISTRVSKNGIISAINQSSESVKIQARNIDLTGATIVNGTFDSVGSDSKIKLINGAIEFFNNENQSTGTIKTYVTGEYLEIIAPENRTIRLRDKTTLSYQLEIGKSSAGWDGNEVHVRAKGLGVLDYMMVGHCKIDYDHDYDRFMLKRRDPYGSFVLARNFSDLSVGNANFYISTNRSHIKGDDFKFELSRYGVQINTTSGSPVLALAGLKIQFDKTNNRLIFDKGSGFKFVVNFDTLKTHWIS